MQLTSLLCQIHHLEKKYSRKEHSIQLLAVSKKQSIEKIADLYTAGQRCFGENYLQEALVKMAALSGKQIEWHFIGTLQRNKTKKIAEHFDWVQTVTDEHIAQRLNDQRPTHLPPLNICIEINISNDKNKSGISPEQARVLAIYCNNLPRLKLRGLMCIPEFNNEIIEQRRILQKMFLLYHSLQKEFYFDTLSMGMSSDMEAAIAEGSTLLRIGTALFGPRA